jgi:type II secretion system protein N
VVDHEAGGLRPVGRLNRVLRRPGVIIASAVVGAVLVFAAFLIASFPYDEMLSTILAPYQLKLVYRRQHFHLPIGVSLNEVNLISVGSSPSETLLESPSIALRPTLGSFFLGRAGLGVFAEIYRGTLAATLNQEREGIGVTFDARALSLRDAPALSQLGALLGGTVSALGSAQIHGPNIDENTGEAAISGSNVTVVIEEGFPMIHLSTVSGRIVLDNGVLTFKNVESHGGDVEAKVDGTLQLDPDFTSSTIEAQLSLTPTVSGRAHFGLLFHMLPHPPSEGPYQVSGPLSSPSIS